EQAAGQLRLRVGGGAAVGEQDQALHAGRVVVGLLLYAGGERFRGLDHERAVEDEQLLLRHRRLGAALAGDVRVGEVEQPQQVVEVVPADLGVDGTADVACGAQVERRAAEGACEL